MATRPAAYGNRLKEQVVGQLFFQSVTGVDQYKTRFSGVRVFCWRLISCHVEYLKLRQHHQDQDQQSC